MSGLRRLRGGGQVRGRVFGGGQRLRRPGDGAVRERGLPLLRRDVLCLSRAPAARPGRKGRDVGPLRARPHHERPGARWALRADRRPLRLSAAFQRNVCRLRRPLRRLPVGREVDADRCRVLRRRGVRRPYAEPAFPCPGRCSPHPALFGGGAPAELIPCDGTVINCACNLCGCCHGYLEDQPSAPARRSAPRGEPSAPRRGGTNKGALRRSFLRQE